MRRPNRRPNYTKMEDVTNWEGRDDYIIYQDGANFIVIDGSNGKEVHRGTDLGLAGQYCIDNMDRGTICLKPGSYTLSTQMYFDGKSNIKFEGYGAVMEMEADWTSRHASYYTAFLIDDSQDITLEGFELNQNGSNQTIDIIGMHITDATTDRIRIRNVFFKESRKGDIFIQDDIIQATIEGCRFYDFGGPQANPYSIYSSGHSQLNIFNNHWDTAHAGSTPQCLYNGGGATSQTNMAFNSYKDVHNCTSPRGGTTIFTNNVVKGVKTALSMTSGNPHVIIKNNDFYDVDGAGTGNEYNCINVQSGSAIIDGNVMIAKESTVNARHGVGLRGNDGTNDCEYCVITNNYMIDFPGANNIPSGVNIYDSVGHHIIENNVFIPPAANNRHGIRSNSNDYNSIVKNNTLLVSTGNVYDDQDSKLTYKGTIGEVLENGGATGVVADAGTFAHGCGITPTGCIVTGTITGDIITVSAIGAANITVAIKDEDGGAGTAQVLYWRAWV